MQLIITKHAFERYRERTAVCQDDFYGFQNRLLKVTRSDLCFLVWKGKPAIYFNHSYWRYERDEKTKQITLITCLGVLEYISTGKWVRQEAAKNVRANKKTLKTNRKKEIRYESSHIV